MRGIAAGAIAGGLLVILGLSATGLWSGTLTAGDLLMLIPVFVGAALTWGQGLIVFAALPWYVLHRLGLRGWRTAITLGAGLTFTAGALFQFMELWNRAGQTGTYGDGTGTILIDGWPTLYGWRVTLELPILLALAGAIVGWVVWRVAYGKSSAHAMERW